VDKGGGAVEMRVVWTPCWERSLSSPAPPPYERELERAEVVVHCTQCRDSESSVHHPPGHVTLVVNACFYHHAECHLQFLVSEGRHGAVSGHLGDWALEQHALRVAELLESLVAAITALTTLTNATKGLVVTDALHQAFVSHETTTGCFVS